MAENEHSKADRIAQIVEESLAIEAEAAKEAGALGFMARALTQATMPHRKTAEIQFSRRNGAFELSITSIGKAGLPYGAIPRLLTAWVATEAVRTKERTIVLGPSLSSFMRELELVPTGGRWGSITRLRDQMKRLFSAAVSATYSDEQRDTGMSFTLVERYDLWWQPKEVNQAALWKSTLTLSQPFFDEVTQSPVPVDMRALKALRRSPMALDIYVWLTYRMSYLSKPTVIPWEALQLQFGADYKLTRQFRAAFLGRLQAVLLIYPNAKVRPTSAGLELYPSPPHIASEARRGFVGRDG